MPAIYQTGAKQLTHTNTWFEDIVAMGFIFSLNIYLFICFSISADKPVTKVYYCMMIDNKKINVKYYLMFGTMSRLQ